MNITNNLALGNPILVVTAGLGVWLGIVWGYFAQREVLLTRLLGPVLGGLLVLGGFSILSAFAQILLVITSFLLTSMFHPIPFTLGILGFSAKLSLDFIQIKIREHVDQAFEYIPPTVAAVAEAEAEAETEILNEETHGPEEQEILIGDVSTHPVLFNQSMHYLPISPLDSPTASSPNIPLEPPVDYNVVESLELIQPMGGAGDVEMSTHA